MRVRALHARPCKCSSGEALVKRIYKSRASARARACARDLREGDEYLILPYGSVRAEFIAASVPRDILRSCAPIVSTACAAENVLISRPRSSCWVSKVRISKVSHIVVLAKSEREVFNGIVVRLC